MAVDDGHTRTIYTQQIVIGILRILYNGYRNQNPSMYLQRTTSICKTPTVLVTHFASTYTGNQDYYLELV